MCGGKQELSISKSGITKSITLGTVESGGGGGTLTSLITRINGGVYTNSGYLSIDGANSTLYHSIGINLNSNYGQFTMNSTSGVTLSSKSSKPININSANDLNLKNVDDRSIKINGSGITIDATSQDISLSGIAVNINSNELLINNDSGTSGQVLVSQGSGKLPI